MCEFSFEFKTTADELFAQLKAQIGSGGGSITGNSSAGSFQIKTVLGKISGNYIISGTRLTVTITQKGLIPCDKIKDFVENRIGQDFLKLDPDAEQ